MTLTARRLAIAILFIGLFAMATRVAVDSDTFWHLRAGTWMLENGRLLNFDVFSHTRFNQPWINHSWLSEILLAAIYRISGYGGLNLITAAVVWLTFLFVYRAGEGGSYLRAFVLVLAVTVSAVYWSARPQIFSMLLTAVFSYVLIQYRGGGSNRLWLLPLLMMLWVNLHGGFAIGFILLVVTFAGEALNWVIGLANSANTQSRDRAVWLAATGLLCAAAVCVNPYGPIMLAYPFRTVSIGALQDYIQEWQSPNFHNRESQVFIVLWLATFAAAGFSRKRLSLTDFLLFSAFTALALVAARNIAVFAVVVAPILMTHANAAIAELQERWPQLKLADTVQRVRRPTLILNWALLILVVAATLIKISIPLLPKTVDEAFKASYPVGAAAYLKAHPAEGRLFNSYNFGGYLTWALYPDTPVYVDGRTDLYEDEFLNEYLAVYLGGPEWQAVFERYHIGVVLVEANAPIARMLIRQPDWAVRYQDARSVVIVKTP